MGRKHGRERRKKGGEGSRRYRHPSSSRHVLHAALTPSPTSHTSPPMPTPTPTLTPPHPNPNPNPDPAPQVLPQSMALVKSPLLQGAALESLQVGGRLRPLGRAGRVVGGAWGVNGLEGGEAGLGWMEAGLALGEPPGPSAHASGMGELS